MSIKRLLPLAGILALVGCASGTGPSCFTEVPEVVTAADGSEVTIIRLQDTGLCQDQNAEP